MEAPKYNKASFNPRICKRCDEIPVSMWIIPPVSIHASVKDATLAKISDLHIMFVSIHASVKDATNSDKHGLRIDGFNPRICKRCDPR